MADIVITPANVIPSSGALIRQGTSGGTITAGMPIYIDEADNNDLKPCDAVAAASAVCVGVALNGASDGQPVTYAKTGVVTIGATVVLGVAYYVTNAGGIGVWAEVDVAEYATLVGIATSTGAIDVQPIVSGGVKA